MSLINDQDLFSPPVATSWHLISLTVFGEMFYSSIFSLDGKLSFICFLFWALEVLHLNAASAGSSKVGLVRLSRAQTAKLQIQPVNERKDAHYLAKFYVSLSSSLHHPFWFVCCQTTDCHQNQWRVPTPPGHHVAWGIRLRSCWFVLCSHSLQTPQLHWRLGNLHLNVTWLEMWL